MNKAENSGPSRGFSPKWVKTTSTTTEKATKKAVANEVSEEPKKPRGKGGRKKATPVEEA